MAVITKSPVATSVPFDNSTNGFTADNVQAAIEEAKTSATGRVFQIAFVGNGTTGNQWIANTVAVIISNQTPYISPFFARLISVDYSNSSINTDPIIKFAISNAASTTATTDRSYKWTITNSRAALKENSTTGFTLSPGDRIGCYVEDGGGNPRDMVLVLKFIITNQTDTTISSNYTGDLSSSNFPATASIPEVFT